MGAVVAALVAVQSWFRVAGTSRAGVGAGAGTAAGRLMVARASLVHQISAAATATTTAIAAAAKTSPLVRRSGLTMRQRGLSWRGWWRWWFPSVCGADGGAARALGHWTASPRPLHRCHRWWPRLPRGVR